jgi:hypothetical protein
MWRAICTGCSRASNEKVYSFLCNPGKHLLIRGMNKFSQPQVGTEWTVIALLEISAQSLDSGGQNSDKSEQEDKIQTKVSKRTTSKGKFSIVLKSCLFPVVRKSFLSG